MQDSAGMGKFRDILKGCTNDVCGMRRVGGQRRKGSEEVGVAVAEKRRAFEEWLQRRDRDTYDRYREQRAVVKQAVKVGKKMADWRWGERLGKDFEENKMMFWKEVNGKAILILFIIIIDIHVKSLIYYL